MKTGHESVNDIETRGVQHDILEKPMIDTPSMNALDRN